MILLTGASGFIGKHLLVALQKKYGIDKVVALTSKQIPSTFCIQHNNYTFDEEYLLKSGIESIEVVIHAGSFTPKERIEADDIVKCNSNIYSTEKLLALKLPKLKKIVYLSTLDVYKNISDTITENTEIEPQSLYGLSKYYCEKVVEAWGSINSICTQILRIGHVYGPGEESYNKLIPGTMRNILMSKDIFIHGEGKEYRSPIYIDDVVMSILNSVDGEENLGPINVVDDRKYTVKEIIDQIVLIAGFKGNVNILETNSISRNLVFDNTKLRQKLHLPVKEFENGLREEWKYMKKFYENIF